MATLPVFMSGAGTYMGTQAVREVDGSIKFLVLFDLWDYISKGVTYRVS